MTSKNCLTNLFNKDFEGTVCEVNEDLCFFILNNGYVINVAYLLSEEYNFHLPQVGQQVTIKKGMSAHCTDSGIIYLCTNSEINLQVKSTDNKDKRLETNSLKENKNTLLKLIEIWKLGIQDLSMIYTNYTKFKSKLLQMSGVTPEQIILQVVQVILGTPSALPGISYCLNRVLTEFEVKSVSDCRYVDINTTNYDGFPYWSFGVHPHKDGELLIGYLYIHPLYGVMMLKDEKYNMLCLVTNKSGSSLKNFINSFVLLKKFTVITEIYKESNVPNLEYIVVDSSDVECLKQLQNDLGSIYSEIIDDSCGHFEHSVIFKLINKSVTLYSVDNRTECWLEILVIESDDDNVSGRLFLCLRFDFIKLVPLLLRKVHYKLCYDGNLDTKCNTELKRIYPNYKQVALSKQKAKFFLHDNSVLEENEQLRNVKECKEFIVSQPKELFQFKGRIKTKKFVDPLSSRTERKIPLYGFGTPGQKTHYLEFAVEDSEVKTLNVYINNWESSLIPCGLVPDTEVIVRNVTHQKGKYCKSTVLTSFEIFEYAPLVRFSTVNLFNNGEIDWGERNFFGAGKTIPYGVLVWAKVNLMQIRSLRIISRCLGCNRETESKACNCMNGGTSGTKLDLMATMIVTDMFGQAKIISSCPDLLRLLLNFEPHQFKLWCEEFQGIGRYEYNNESTTGSSDKILFCKTLTNLIKTINAVGIVNEMELCCRKLNSQASLSFAEPIWYCIRARKEF